ncbi:MAG: hypothetical protein J6C19_06250 [Lachnospiraceae bacterium]|nr:hypothetical protein [Lachnospiraceae bacterium]MBO5145121.1 hypothetical protein [Lachnospiraceae bacterium]
MAAENRQARRKQQNKSGKTMNRIELAIFGAMTIYIFVVIVMYLKSEPIKGYEIQMGSLSVSKTYTGIALRQEELLTSPYTGYINYYVREGERVSSRDTVYSIDESGKLDSLLNSGDMGENTYSDEELSELRSEVIQYDRTFDSKDFKSVYDFKYDLEGSVVKLVNLNMYESMEALNQSSLGGMVSLCTAGKSGYIVYNTDGYETLTPEQITQETFDQSNYEKNRVNNNDLIEKNATIGKLITDENWSLIIPIDADRTAELEEEEYVKIKFIKTQEVSWAQVAILHLADGDYAQLSFNNSCVSFCTDRFVDIELVVDDEQGLKVPNSAIVEKEFFIIPAEYMCKGGANGNYGVSKEAFDENGNVVYEFVETTVYNSDENEFYVDDSNLSVGDYICKPDSTDKMAVSQSGTLIGVYNMNKGYADFKQITVLAKNDEYSIVSSNTQYGLTVYDRIVLDAASVDNDDFIYN